MNFKITIALFLSTGAFIISLYLLFNKSQPVKNEATKTENIEEPVEEPKEAPLEIAHFMTRIQVFHNKLYFAGINKNTRLAQFYLNELEEEMGSIAEAGIFEVDVNISDNIKTYGIKQVEIMRTQIEKGFDTFESDFEILTTSCNSCHTVTKHDYVQIMTPTAPMFTNQKYQP
jgi:cytochrome c556